MLFLNKNGIVCLCTYVNKRSVDVTLIWFRRPQDYSRGIH